MDESGEPPQRLRLTALVHLLYLSYLAKNFIVKKHILIFSIAVLFSYLSSAQKKITQFVDPFIGTGGHGHTYPGAVLPHGMVQLSPDTRLDGWDGCSGYHYSDNYIYGFTHTHLSGTGCSDYGDILLMPTIKDPSPDNKVYGSVFSHKSEIASPGYYSVTLGDKIDVELTTTERVGFHKYHFVRGANMNVMLDLKHRDEVIESSLQIVNDHTVTGMRRSKAWAEDQYEYFALEFSMPFANSVIWKDDQLVTGSGSLEGKNLKACFQWTDPDKRELIVKVALSAVSVEGARKNLNAEAPGWDFDAVRFAGDRKWNAELGKIEVKDGDVHQMRTFYTALYHTMVVPNINMDVDGRYRGRDNKIHTAEGFTNYSVFSLWDTYRGAHPLYTIIDKQRTLDYIKSFLVQYQEGGRLPVWELSSCETDCMIGYHSVPVIVDAYMKGITGFDTKLALEAMKKSSTWNHLGLPALIDHGVLEMGDEHENVSKTLEYAYDDWCIARFAKANGDMNAYYNYIQRAQFYKNLLDLKTGFMRPRKNGNFISPFDPREVNNNFTEANSWQYSFYMPQDVEGYMKMIGGKKKLELKLDQLFSQPTETSGRNQADITGLIGQYAHGNEPSHHIIYLYNFAGTAYKTQEKVHQVMKEMYHDTPDGLAGNEDCGQMSAWYVLSAMGFYPVTPGTTDYIIGTPLFKEVAIHLENGKTFSIKAVNADDKNFYVQSAVLNGKGYPKSFIAYDYIANGGELIFNMGAKPSAFGNTNSPSTSINDKLLVLNPVIDGGEMAFKGEKRITIYSNQKPVTIHYTTDGSAPALSSPVYLKPFSVYKTTTVKAVAFDNMGQHSYVTKADYKEIPHDWSIRLNTAFEPQYEADGAPGLIDGIRGEADWRKGNWQGYQNADLDAVIDMKQKKTISTVTGSFLQDARSWIMMPKQFIVEVSTDGKNFNEVYSRDNFLPADDLKVQTKTVVATFSPIEARYVRIRALQYGKLPAWHESAGSPSHLFVDELDIE